MVRCEVSVGKIETKHRDRCRVYLLCIPAVYTCCVYLLCSKKDN